jgi:uncharacterized protein with FMN-binding domain
MARRLSRRLLGLSGAAVAAVYAVGLRTSAGASAELAALAAAPTPTVVRIPRPAPTARPAAIPVTAAGEAAGSAAAPAATEASVSGGAPGQASAPGAQGSGGGGAGVEYKDGTYSGQGDSRRGGFEVAVSVQIGRIATVTITKAWTHYPVSRIAPLPGQVVARQSDRVDRISGATYSVQAFQQAVRNALAHAVAV